MHATDATQSPEANPAEDRSLELSIAHGGDRIPFTLTNDDQAIIIPEGLSYEEWKRGLKLFEWASKRLKQAFPKYLAYGELKFGREAALQGVQQLEFDLPMVNEAIKLNGVPEEVRQPGLTNAHLIVLARSELTKKDQIKWAKTASEQQLSPTTLKISIEEGEVVTPEMARQRAHGLYSPHGIRGEFDIWEKKVGGLDGIKKMKTETITEIVHELDAIADLRDALVEFLQ